MLITIEGLNGVGKDFILDKVKEELKEESYVEFITSKVPSEKLHKNLTELDQCSLEELLDFSDIFIKNMENLTSILKDDKVYISNRWSLSTYVYTRFSVEKYISYHDLQLSERYSDYLKFNFNVKVPNYIVYLECPIEVQEERLKNRGKYVSVYEEKENNLICKNLFEKALEKRQPENIFRKDFKKAEILKLDTYELKPEDIVNHIVNLVKTTH